MSLSSGDLTTLATAKNYIDAVPSDLVLSGLITRVSRMILSTLNRPLLVPKQYVEQFNGTGTTGLVLPNYPVLSITSLKVSGQTLAVAPQLGDSSTFTSPYGYRAQPWNGVPPGDPTVLELTGGAFYVGGSQNVVVTYSAGYQVTSESQVIPGTPFQVTPATPFGSWATNQGVSYSGGAALVAVSNSPTVGQYVPPNPTASPPVAYYLFNSADAGKTILLSYGFIPADVEQVALELIAERAAYRKRIGIRSQMLASQETIVYDLRGMSSWAIEALSSYISVIPPAIGASV